MRRVYNQTALRNQRGRALSMLEAWSTKKVTADIEEELSHTQYTERKLKYTLDFASLIDFGVNVFVRISDIKDLRHEHGATGASRASSANSLERERQHQMKNDPAVLREVVCRSEFIWPGGAGTTVPMTSSMIAQARRERGDCRIGLLERFLPICFSLVPATGKTSCGCRCVQGWVRRRV